MIKAVLTIMILVNGTNIAAKPGDIPKTNSAINDLNGKNVNRDVSERYSITISNAMFDFELNCAGGVRGKAAKGTKCVGDCVEGRWCYTDDSKGWGAPCGVQYCMP